MLTHEFARPADSTADRNKPDTGLPNVPHGQDYIGVIRAAACPRRCQKRLAKFLYHYQPLRGETHEERLRQLLTDQKIYCSTPAQVNDIWDCKPYFDPDAFHELAMSPDGGRFLEGIMANPDISHEASSNLLRDPIHRAKLIAGVTEQVGKNTEKRWRMYCLSRCPLINLMWSFYGHSHTGICLEFSVENDVFSRAREVAYSTVFPKPKLDEEGMALQILLTKSSDWAFEKEFRLLARVPSSLPPQFAGRVLVTDENNFLPLPPGALTAIIVGHNGEVEVVKRIMQECGAKVQIKRAVQRRDAYKLDLRDVT